VPDIVAGGGESGGTLVDVPSWVCTMGGDGAPSGGRIAGDFSGAMAEMCTADSTMTNKIIRMERRFMLEVSGTTSKGLPLIPIRTSILGY
jgi:hypothetical protein